MYTFFCSEDIFYNSFVTMAWFYYIETKVNQSNVIFYICYLQRETDSEYEIMKLTLSYVSVLC